MIGTILVLGVVHEAREVLIPIACAFMLTFICTPATRRLQRLRLGKMPAASLVVLFCLGVGGGIAWLTGQQVYDLASNLPSYERNIHEKLSRVHTYAGRLMNRFTRSVDELRAEQVETENKTRAPEQKPTSAAAQPVQVQVVEAPPGIRDVLREMVGPLLAPLMDVGIVIVFLFFMLVQREDLRDRLIRLIGQGRLSVTTQALDDAGQRMSRYLMFLAIVNGTFGTLVGLALWFLGIPNATLWGFLAGVLRFIPFLGPWLGLSMPLLVAVATTPGWTTPLEVVGLFFVLELITNSVAEPLLYGAGTGISTLAVVVSAVFWAWMWGPPGLILATPLTVCLVVISRYVPHLEFLGVLLGDERALSMEAHFYQRLLAGDQVEAAESVDGYLKGHPVVALYDGVVLPALAMGEQDRQEERLSVDRHRFILQAIGELVDDLSEREPAAERSRPGRVLVMPARDAADAMAGRLLAQLITAQGVPAVALSAELGASELLEAVARERADVFVISAIPPYAAMYATYLCRKLSKRFPGTPTVVGLWTSGEPETPAHKRIRSACGDRMATSLAQALGQTLSLLPAGVETEEDGEPADEAERVRALEALAILDTEPEPVFDRIVEEVARALKAPIALIALVDAHREWWKATFGVPAELASAGGTPRDVSLAARVVASGKPLYRTDVRSDARLAASPLVTACGAHFVAGIPLKDETGRAVGALLVLDTQPRHLTDSERALLELVAQNVMTQIRMRRK